MSQLSEQENTHLYMFLQYVISVMIFFVCPSVYLAEDKRRRGIERERDTQNRMRIDSQTKKKRKINA